MIGARTSAALAVALCLLAACGCGAWAEPAFEPLDRTVCRLIERAADRNRLPVGFMARLIWRESSFRAGAVSPAGAQGIAQFMPGTAASRGLADPFDPEQAIPKAARLIAELRRRFGNLGIAAAAYNAGAARVDDWLRGQGGLPAETRAYVRFVTERGAEEWRAAGSAVPERAAADPAADGSCLAVVGELRRDGGGAAGESEPLAPWGVQLAGNFSKAVALASFERAARRYAGVIGEARPMIIGRVLRSRGTRRFYQVRVPAASRAAAEALCRRIRGAGGACIAIHS